MPKRFERKIPKDDYEKIRDLLLEGNTYQFIADIYGVSRQRIRQIAKRYELQRYGLSLRASKQADIYFAKTKKKYGNFWKGGFLEKTDFMYACKEKFIIKKNAAKRRGVEFTITMEDLEWPTHCPILGIELQYFTNAGRQEDSVSFDRIDPTKGYVPGNVYICSWRANRLKNNGTAEEHKKIYEFMLAIQK